MRPLIPAIAMLLASGPACERDAPTVTPVSATATTAPTDLPPPGVPSPIFTRAQVDRALPLFEQVLKDALASTGVPGLAAAVVWGDEVVFMKGFGVREVGKSEPIDADTVFQLASLSKPVGATVIASLVASGIVDWDKPITTYDATFALGDAWVTKNITLADLFSHRSGLPDHAGDLLEDLGFDRGAVLARLRFYPLGPFRNVYHYTNFGLTAAANAAAKAAGKSWEDVSQERLYRPLGMSSTSSRHSDYLAAPNHASLHVRVAGVWKPSPGRQPDPQSPAGGVSSSTRDMTRWLRLQLGRGSIDGEPVLPEAELGRTHLVEMRSGVPRVYDGRAGSYGLGWNVGVTDQGQTMWGHSGAFALGAATTVALLPTERLGVVVLTNGEPFGMPEAMIDSFLDLVRVSHVERDWLSLRRQQFAPILAGDPKEHDYAAPPAGAKPSRPSEAYEGSFANDLYGPLVVQTAEGGVVMRLGPSGMTFPLTAYDGDLFTWIPPGESATGRSGVTFAVDASGKARSVRIEHLDAQHLGTFVR